MKPTAVRTTGMLAVSILVAVFAAPQSAVADDKVTLCHATGAVSNPYDVFHVDPASITQEAGHGSHLGPIFDPSMTNADAWGDIIPAFGTYPGLNVAAGQTWLARDCAPPPKLTLVKTVVNTGGGTADKTDWTLRAEGTTSISGPTGTTGAVLAGTYTLSESGGPSGYTPSDWVCTNATVNGQTITIGKTDVKDVTCTITNTFVPVPPVLAQLTLVKVVVGSNEPVSSWTLDATGGPTAFAEGPSGTSHPVAAGDYTLSEFGGPSGYTASDWYCSNDDVGPTITISSNGGAVTCTITNTFVPTPPHMADLTLVKVVVGGNESAGAWTLGATDGPTPFVQGPTGTRHAVEAGTYALSESGPSGYTGSDWVCPGAGVSGDRGSQTVTIGSDVEAVTCTITNTFVPTPPPPAPPVVPLAPDTPAISVVKLATLGDTNGNGKSDAGETISYSFRVTNTGNVALTTVAVADPMLDLVVGSSAVTCNPTTLLAGAEVTCTAAAYTVTAGDIAHGAAIVNLATASGQPPNGNRVTATDTVRTPTQQPAAPVAPVTPVVQHPTQPPAVLGIVKAAPAATTPAATTLAFTGAGTVPLGLSGLLALVLGAFLTVAGRRQGGQRARE